MSSTKEIIERLLKLDSEAMKDAPFHVVSGDAAMRMQPHSKLCVNTTSSWLVSDGNSKSRHKLIKSAEFYNETETMMTVIKELIDRLDRAKSQINSYSWSENFSYDEDIYDLTKPLRK